MNFYLRDYCPLTDIHIIISLHSKIFSFSKEEFPKEDDLKNMKGHIVINKENLEIIAYLLFSEYTSKNISLNYLDYIGVSPFTQSKGVGTYLMNLLVKNLDILCVEENTPFTDRLIEWYKRFGFEIYKSRIMSEKDIYLTIMTLKDKQIMNNELDNFLNFYLKF